MSVLVKICGLSTEETVDAALDAGADLIGFVFFPPSPRHISLDRARDLSRRVGGRAGKVALTVDADDAQLSDIAAAMDPDLLQLHGHESPARAGAIAKAQGLPVMKALPVALAADLTKAAEYAGIVQHLLFDARPPKEATRPGGLGRAFDWRLLSALDRDVSFLLSGGLDAENVEEAIRIAQPAGVDVSSGVERAPGDKDPEKIYAFVRAARSGAQAPSPSLAKTVR